MMEQCPTYEDFKWYTYYQVNPSFYTDAQAAVYSEFEQALFGDSLRSILPLSAIAQVADTTIEDVTRFFKYGDLTIDFRGLGGAAARHINNLDAVAPITYDITPSTPFTLFWFDLHHQDQVHHAHGGVQSIYDH